MSFRHRIMADDLVSTLRLQKGKKVSLEQVRKLFEYLRTLPEYYQINELPFYEAGSLWAWAQKEATKRRSAGKSAEQLYQEGVKRSLDERLAKELPMDEIDDSELAKVVYSWTVAHSMVIRRALDQLESVLGETVGFVYDGLTINLPVDARYYNLQPGGTSANVLVNTHYVRTVWGGPEDKPKRLVSAQVEKKQQTDDDKSFPMLLDLHFALRWAIANLDPDVKK